MSQARILLDRLERSIAELRRSADHQAVEQLETQLRAIRSEIGTDTQ